jgi:dTDP-4-dehydrorhamnose reductase
LEQGFEVKGTSAEDIPGTERLDICDAEETERIIYGFAPDVVFHLASLTNVDYCETHKKEAEKVNVEGTANVATACKQTGARMVFVSTDYVFDGKKGNYKESDKPKPVNVYGRTKLEGEKIVSKLVGSLILRVSSLYGYNGPSDKKTFEKFVIEKLKAGGQVKAVSQVTCPTLIDDASRAMIALVQKNASGVFHSTGPEGISRHGFALKVARVFGLNEKLVVQSDDFSGPAKRPGDSSLNISKLQSLEISMSGVEAGLNIEKKQMEGFG